MRKLFSILSAALLAALICTSCVSTKKIVYFQGADSIYSTAQKIMQQYEMKLKPADQVLIKITCSEPDLLKIFAQDLTMGTFGTNSSNMNMGGSTMTNAYGYTVTNSGELILPAIGAVQVDGTTVDECAKIIEKKIIEKGYIKDPEVTVRLLNARVTVVGAVKTPKVVNLTSERNTIVDVISQCSDIDDTGLRYKIQLFREENGKLKVYDIDLTKSDVFNSPAYYVQQNDMVYVSPNQSKRIKSSAFYTGLSAWSSVIGVLSTVASMTVLIYNVINK
ncbi:MAG: polysaccharide biosynthesis/export family protein [Bacteroidaceae bacterium]|nr:polysaccharide biosynthesis/export family protein [Bacteroidaceae bacterium]